MGDKADFWKGHFEAWAGSGLTQAAYCRQHDLSLAGFGYWRGRLRATSTARPRSAGLLPIVVGKASSADQTIEVRLPNGLRVQLPVAMEASRWLPMIQALRTC